MPDTASDLSLFQVEYRDLQDRLCEIELTATGVSHARNLARERLGDRALSIGSAWRCYRAGL